MMLRTTKRTKHFTQKWKPLLGSIQCMTLAERTVRRRKPVATLMHGALAALFIGPVPTGPAVAQRHLHRYDWDRRPDFLEPPPLPEGIIGNIRPGAGARPVKLNRIKDVFDTIKTCWQRPGGDEFSGQELSILISFKRNGEVLGKPRITYYKPGTGGPDRRDAFTQSVREAFERCTPLPFSDSFGGAIAGRPFVFRFVDARPL